MQALRIAGTGRLLFGGYGNGREITSSDSQQLRPGEMGREN